jgi:hypothetical protein
MFHRIRAVVISLLLIAAAIYLGSAPTTQPPRYRLPDEVGFLEHRGKRYFLNDLMDPAYRAASDDLFVRQFDDAVKIADGKARGDSISIPQSVNTRRGKGMIPWAGRDPDAHAERQLMAGPDP